MLTKPCHELHKDNSSSPLSLPSFTLPKKASFQPTKNQKLLQSLQSMAFSEAFKLGLLIVALIALPIPSDALNIGIQSTDVGVQVKKECSRTCESEFCSVPPLLKYGKYCGLLYSGCPGERPCDGLDACCMNHDACVQSTGGDYISQGCSQKLLNCMNNFQKSGGRTFKGSTCQAGDVVEVIKVAMEAALIAGRVFNKP